MKRILAFVFAFLLILSPISTFAGANDNFKIVNKDKNNKDILGFQYELYDDSTGKLIKEINLTSDSSYSMSLSDGKYKLVETKRPDGYDKAKDIEFTLPTKDGSRSIEINPKHIPSTEKPKKEEHKYTPTGVMNSKVPMIAAVGIAVIAVLLEGRVFKKSEQEIK